MMGEVSAESKMMMAVTMVPCKESAQGGLSNCEHKLTVTLKITNDGMVSPR